MKYPVLRCLVVTALLSGAVPAHAADPYPFGYVGLGAGYSRVQFYPADFASGLTDSSKNFDAGFRGFLGWQVNRNWAVEVGYTQLGKFMYNTQFRGAIVSQEIDYKATGVEFSFLPTVPITRKLSLFGRLGGFFSQARTTVYNPNGIPSGAGSNVQTNQTSFLTGLGFQYLGDEAGLRIEYENFGPIGSTCNPGQVLSASCTGRVNAKMVSVNGVFKF
jgi:OOP family OmpA-OmpF porin